MTKHFPHNADFTRLFILRHAETDLNAAGKIQGETEVGLNAKGRQQARKTARRLARYYHLDHIYTSPYPRARETAEIIARPYKLNVEANEDLHELTFGKINNERFIDLETIQPEYFHQINHLYATKAEEGVSKPPFPEGESVAEIRSRASSASPDTCWPTTAASLWQPSHTAGSLNTCWPITPDSHWKIPFCSSSKTPLLTLWIFTRTAPS